LRLSRRKIPNRTPEPAASPYQIKRLTPAEIQRGIAMRRYAWRKPMQQIADEAGVAKPVINKVLNREPVSDASYAALTSYLRTPAGKWALVNNRQGRASEDSPRHPLMRRVMRLTGMAINYGIKKVFSRESCASMTQGELRAYYYRLDFRVKERILNDPRWPDSIKAKFVIPDSLEAWEWVERLDQLTERQITSASARNGRT
jgi:hypothetical protein